MKYIIALAIILMITLVGYKTYQSTGAQAICKPSETSTPYCKYKGEIDKVYINNNGLVLVFLNKSFNIGEAKGFGYDIKAGNIVAIDLNKENQFSRELFDMTMLAFQHESAVELHARQTTSGYLVVDRIWVSK